MVTHWESSRRPLYVKTIWKDGQHHVILDKTKENLLETSQLKKTKQNTSNQNSHRSAKSANTGVNLKVSSVRVLLSGVNGFKNSRNIHQKKGTGGNREYFVSDKPETWRKSTVNCPITTKNLNKEISFNAIQGTKAPNLRKSITVDSECVTTEKHPEPLPNIVPDNALSEKVMIWLDLAIHQGHIDREIRQEQAMTAQACPLLEKPFRKSCDVRENYDIQEEIANSSILKNSASPREEDLVVYSNEEVEVLEEDFYHVLTPNISEDCDCEEAKADKKHKRINTAKRQLHIFMPNLPKKLNDCDSSILSCTSAN